MPDDRSQYDRDFRHGQHVHILPPPPPGVTEDTIVAKEVSKVKLVV